MLPWFTVQSYPPNEGVSLPLRDGSSINLGDFVVANVPDVRQGGSYYLKWLLGSGHAQTIMASARWDGHYKIWYGRRLFKWSDGSQISADYALPDGEPASSTDWAEATKYYPEKEVPRLSLRTRYLRPEELGPLDNPDTTTPLVVTLHGMTGGSHENYVRAAIEQILSTSNNFECVVLNTRGCNRTKLTTPIPFNAAWTEDVRQFVRHVTDHQPKRPIYLVGYSLGASILANYLGQEAENVSPQIAAACLVGCPFDLTVSQICIEQSYIGHYLYSKTMAQNLCRYVRNNRAQLDESPLVRSQLLKLDNAVRQGRLNSINDFDDLISAPVLGFVSAFDYYRTCSCSHRIKNIRVPTLTLSSLDDPVVGKDAIPYTDIRANPYMHFVTTTAGGHLGWFTASGRRWYADVVADFFSSFDAQVELSARAKPTKPAQSWFAGDRFDPKMVLASLRQEL